MDLGTDLATRVREVRKARMLSQEALAREAGVSLNLVNKLERGVVTDPHYSTLSGLARALDMTVEELIEGQPVPLGEAQPPRRPAAEDKDHDPTEEVRKQLFNPDLNPFEQSIVERAAEHVSRWSGRADLMEKIEARDVGPAYSLVVKDWDAVKEDTKLLLRDMMAHLDRAGAEPLTGVWLKLGREVADVTDRVLAAVDRLKEEHRALWAEDAAACREMFGAVPGPEAEPEETSKEEYDNVIYWAFPRADGNGERRAAG